MKKLFSLLTVLLCAVVLSTTAFAADPQSIYQKYLDQQDAVTSMNLSMVQKLYMVSDGEEVEVSKQNIGAKINITPEGKLEMEMRAYDAATKEFSTIYFRHDYMYQEVGGEKYKIKMDMNDALAGSLGAAASVDESLTEDVLKNAKIDLVDDGIRISYKISASDMDSNFASLLKDIDLPDGVKMNFSDMSISMTIGSDGVLKSYTNNAGVSISEGDVNLALKVSQSVKVNSINSGEKIYFPADLGDYKLVA